MEGFAKKNIKSNLFFQRMPLKALKVLNIFYQF